MWRLLHGSKPGPHQYLTDEECLVCYLQDVAEIGYRKTHEQVQVIVEVATEKGLMDGKKKHGCIGLKSASPVCCSERVIPLLPFDYPAPTLKA